MLLQMIIIFPLICIVRFWFICIVKCDRKALKSLKPGSNILIFTAHPDDECMFFGPVITKLVSKGYNVYLLCCSAGNFYGKGEERKKELIKSCEILGIKSEHIRVLEDERVQDDPKADWNVPLLSSLLQSHVRDYNIKNVITFDEKGVSLHANHVSLYHVARTASFQEEKVAFFKLKTTNIYRKYIGVLDMLATFMKGQLVFVSSFSTVIQIQKAMFAHWSQMEWFRVLYILFSRYMIMNDIELMDQKLLKQS